MEKSQGTILKMPAPTGADGCFAPFGHIVPKLDTQGIMRTL